MSIVSATECTIYSSITASVSTILASGLIPIVQDRICLICNNNFETDLYLQQQVTFNTSARTIVGTSSYESENFLAGDDIFLFNSYRNDGVYSLESVSGSTLTLISGQTVVDELSGASVYISVIKWPLPIKHAASLMVAYDYDVRPKQAANLKAHSLGPFSESFTTGSENPYGYPDTIMQFLIPYRMARIV
jgi:hypothetical protein